MGKLIFTSTGRKKKIDRFHGAQPGHFLRKLLYGVIEKSHSVTTELPFT